jgi:hypothetical protein
VEDIVELVVQLKSPAAGTIKEYKGSLEKFRTHYGNDFVLGSSKEDATAFERTSSADTKP